MYFELIPANDQESGLLSSLYDSVRSKKAGVWNSMTSSSVSCPDILISATLVYCKYSYRIKILG